MQKIHALLISLIIIVFGAVAIAAIIFSNKKDDKDRFTVSGSGSVYAKADIANITVGIKSGTMKTAADASKEANNKMNAIISEIKKLNIDEKDIKTSDYRLNPVNNWTQDKGQELVGYEVTENLTLKIRDLNIIGDVIAKSTELGANQIGDINFTIDDESELKNQARDIAIQKAKEKAQMIAKQTGMKLGAIKDVSETSDQAIRPMFASAKTDSVSEANESVPAPEIQTGQNEVKVDVNLVYEIK